MKNLRCFPLLFCMLLMASVALAQTVTIHGVVTDAGNGDAVIGATVLEIGTQNGTVTDFDGQFTLTVNKGATLQFSYVGYKSQELVATAVMSFRLQEDTEVLEE